MIPLLIHSLILLAVVVSGIVVIVLIREKLHGTGAGRGDCDETWEQKLAEYKKLRDRGVLEEDEYRRIRTLGNPFPKDAENIPKTLPVILKRATGEDRRT
ncbi:MAG: hypothetical protein HOB45_02915 [Planctomycetaceae bacterium]|nr:hypothetical protein [Planctomycetaceae bacterium]